MSEQSDTRLITIKGHDAVSDFFQGIQTSLKPREAAGYEGRLSDDGKTLTIIGNAAVDTLDFRNNTVGFSPIKVESSTQVFGFNSSFRVNKNEEDKAVNITDLLRSGYGDQLTTEERNATVINLPDNAIPGLIHVHYEGRFTGPGSPDYLKLTQESRADKDYESSTSKETGAYDVTTTGFQRVFDGGEALKYVLDAIQFDEKDTPINVILDNQDRTLIVPDSDTNKAGLLHYAIEGGSGDYQLQVPAEGDVAITSSDSAPGQWNIQVAGSDFPSNVVFGDNDLTIGDVHLSLDKSAQQGLQLNLNNRTEFSVDFEHHLLQAQSVNGASFASEAALQHHLQTLGQEGALQPVTKIQDFASDNGQEHPQAFYVKDQHQLVYFNDLDAGAQRSLEFVGENTDGHLFFADKESGSILRADPEHHRVAERFSAQADHSAASTEASYQRLISEIGSFGSSGADAQQIHHQDENSASQIHLTNPKDH